MNNILIPNSFPNLPDTIQKMQLMFAKEDVNMQKLILLLEEEPILCANILAIVNSPYYGIRNKITSISHAVSLLGITLIRGIIMAVILKKSFPLDLSPYNITLSKFDKICTLRMRFLKVWIQDKYYDIDKLSSVAFLMECGKIVASNIIIKNNLTSDFKRAKKENTILNTEKYILDTNSYELASLLFKQWLFEDKFTELLKSVPNPKTDEEKVLNVISNIINVNGILNRKNIEISYLLIEKYNFDIDIFKKSIDIITKEL